VGNLGECSRVVKAFDLKSLGLVMIRRAAADGGGAWGATYPSEVKRLGRDNPQENPTLVGGDEQYG